MLESWEGKLSLRIEDGVNNIEISSFNFYYQSR